MSPEFLAEWLGGSDEAARPRAIIGLGVLADGWWDIARQEERAEALAASGSDGIATWFEDRWTLFRSLRHWPERLEWDGNRVETWEALRSLFDPEAVAEGWREFTSRVGDVDLSIEASYPRNGAETEAVFRWLSEQAWAPGSGIGGWFCDSWQWGRGGRSAWHWPLRIGFLADPASQALLDEYREDERSWVRGLSVAVEVERTGLPCDLLLSPLGAVRTAKALRRARTQASAVALIGPKSVPRKLAAPVKALREACDAATVAFAPCPADYGFLVELIRHISHDRCLDSAIAAACRGTPEPPLVIAHIGAMKQTRISRLAEQWAERLERRGDSQGAGLLRSEARSGYLSETGDATRILELAAETGARRPVPRYLNASIWTYDRKERRGALEPAQRLAREGWSVVATGLGTAKPDSADEVSPFPDWPFDGGEVQDLTVVLVAPGCEVASPLDPTEVQVGRDGRLVLLQRFGRAALAEAPLDIAGFEPSAVGEIRAGAIGGSTLAAFFVRPLPGLERFKARIMVMHGNRVLQTAILEGAIGDARWRQKGGEDGDDRDSIRLRTEGVVRGDLEDLDDRRQFDLAILTNDSLTGSPQFTAVAGGEVVLRDFGALEGVPERIGARMQQLVYAPEGFGASDGDAATELLKQLAHEGVLIRDALSDAGLGRMLAEDPPRIQLVSAKPDAVLPVEFIYDGPAPDYDAAGCPGQAAALAAGTCGDCPNRESHAHVCAMRFWGMRKVIERQIYNPDTAAPHDVLTTNPSPQGKGFKRPAKRLFACADRAGALPRGEAAIKALCSRLNGATAATWSDWRARIAADAPGLLLLLPHTDRNAFGEYLEIGTGEKLGGAQIRSDIVGSQEPVLVLLLGCETAAADIPYAKFIGRFRCARAAVVIGTLMPVLGRHAAPVAEALVARLEDYWQAPMGAVTVGDAIAAMRRDLLLQGLPVGLAVVAIGDADWLIGA